MALTLPLDLAMASPATNRVVDEPHLIDTAESRFFVPQGGPFFALGVELKIGATLLMPGVHYQILHMYEEATLASGKEVDAIVYIKDTPQTPLGSTVQLTCHYVGGPYSATTDALQQILDNLTLPGAESLGWGSVLNKPVQYPPAAHLHHIRNIFGTDEMVTVLEGVRQAILQGDQGTINALYQYIDGKIAQLGSAMEAAFATAQAIQTAITTHQAASNAHPKASVGLGNVPNYPAANATTGMDPANDASLMTPLRVFNAITSFFGRPAATDYTAYNPNTTTKAVMVAKHANCPRGDVPYLIFTYFDLPTNLAIDATTPRTQVAIRVTDQGAVPDPGILTASLATRRFDGINWTTWGQVSNGIQGAVIRSIYNADGALYDITQNTYLGSSPPQITDGVALMNVNYTPVSASNLIRVTVTVPYITVVDDGRRSLAGLVAHLHLNDGANSIAGAIGEQYWESSGDQKVERNTISFVWQGPATAGTMNFKLRAGRQWMHNPPTMVRVNDPGMAGTTKLTMIIEEIQS